jgi:hypothetical protein
MSSDFAVLSAGAYTFVESMIDMIEDHTDDQIPGADSIGFSLACDCYLSVFPSGCSYHGITLPVVVRDDDAMRLLAAVTKSGMFRRCAKSFINDSRVVGWAEYPGSGPPGLGVRFQGGNVIWLESDAAAAFLEGWPGRLEQ